MVNIVASILSIITGHQKVAKKFSCGLFGRPLSEKTMLFGWMLPFSLTITANVVIAALILYDPDYKKSFPMVDLVFFLVARPRLTWFSLALIGELSPSSNPFTGKEQPWISAACSVLVAEVFLQLITGYYMGTTAHFAATRGYYKLSTLPGPVGHNAHLMYGAALFWLVVGSGVLIYAVLLILVVFRGTVEQDEQRERSIMHGIVLFLLIVNWLATWLFWAGFVRLAGDL